MHGLDIGKRLNLAAALAVSKCCKPGVSADCVLCCLKVSCNISGDIGLIAVRASSITFTVIHCR